MTTLTLPEKTNQDTSENLTHYISDNDPDIALCGADISQEPWTDTAVDCKACLFEAEEA